jgi:hypothetical protein
MAGRILYSLEQPLTFEAVRPQRATKQGRRRKSAEPATPQPDETGFIRYGTAMDFTRFRRHAQAIADREGKPYSILNWSRKGCCPNHKLRPWRLEHELNGDWHLVEVIQPKAA